jgi:hypothetical protein
MNVGRSRFLFHPSRSCVAGTEWKQLRQQGNEFLIRSILTYGKHGSQLRIITRWFAAVGTSNKFYQLRNGM